MRYMVLVGALATCVVCAGICDAEDKKVDASVRKEAADKGVKGVIRHMDVGSADEPDSAVRPPMEQWETYDENTGLRDVTKSDSEYELE